MKTGRLYCAASWARQLVRKLTSGILRWYKYNPIIDLQVNKQQSKMREEKKEDRSSRNTIGYSEIFTAVSQHLMASPTFVVTSNKIWFNNWRKTEKLKDCLWHCSLTHFSALQYLFQESCRPSQDCKNQSWTSDVKAISCVYVHVRTHWLSWRACLYQMPTVLAVHRFTMELHHSIIFIHPCDKIPGCCQRQCGRWKKLWWTSLLIVARPSRGCDLLIKYTHILLLLQTYWGVWDLCRPAACPFLFESLTSCLPLRLRMILGLVLTYPTMIKGLGLIQGMSQLIICPDNPQTCGVNAILMLPVEPMPSRSHHPQ